MPFDVIKLAQKLIACPSVTPLDKGAQNYLTERLEELGFECFNMSFGEGEERVPNLYARLGTGSPHFCYAGHTDVVPPGPEEEWTYGPFNPQIEDGVLYGRGASDMKGSVAAFIAALSQYLEDNTLKGSISVLITGDEEGYARNGTFKVLEWMEKNGHIPDVALVGEPTNRDHLGQEIKIGRRGSINGIVTVTGKQGHVAYQHFADNPVPKLIKIFHALESTVFDEGSEYFPPTNLETTTFDVGNHVKNVIPHSCTAQFNVRFNDLWTTETIVEKLHEIIKAQGFDYEMELRPTFGAESFLTQPGDWSEIVRKAVKDITGETAEYTTNGGTSDARFIIKYCPVVEFGGLNASIHQINENAKVEDLYTLTKVFKRVLELYLK